MAREIDGFLVDGSDDSGLTLILANGAGAPMDTPFMSAIAEGLGDRGYRVVRFEFRPCTVDGKTEATTARSSTRLARALARGRRALVWVRPNGHWRQVHGGGWPRC